MPNLPLQRRHSIKIRQKFGGAYQDFFNYIPQDWVDCAANQSPLTPLHFESFWCTYIRQHKQESNCSWPKCTFPSCPRNLSRTEEDLLSLCPISDFLLTHKTLCITLAAVTTYPHHNHLPQEEPSFLKPQTALAQAPTFKCSSWSPTAPQPHMLPCPVELGDVSPPSSVLRSSAALRSLL